MELTIAMALSILSSVIAVISFALSRKDKSNKDVASEQYEKGKTEQQLKNILEKLDKIEKKLDGYDKDIDDKISAAMQNHIAIYHKEG